MPALDWFRETIRDVLQESRGIAVKAGQSEEASMGPARYSRPGADGE